VALVFLPCDFGFPFVVVVVIKDSVFYLRCVWLVVVSLCYDFMWLNGVVFGVCGITLVVISGIL